MTNQAIDRHHSNPRAPCVVLKPCFRCKAEMRLSLNGEPECLQCGNVDYSYEAPKSKVKKRRGIAGRGKLTRVRYGGTSSKLVAHVATLEANRAVGSKGYEVTAISMACPYCRGEMWVAGDAKKDKKKIGYLFRCVQRHSVGLYRAKDGGLFWE